MRPRRNDQKDVEFEAKKFAVVSFPVGIQVGIVIHIINVMIHKSFWGQIMKDYGRSFKGFRIT